MCVLEGFLGVKDKLGQILLSGDTGLYSEQQNRIWPLLFCYKCAPPELVTVSHFPPKTSSVTRTVVCTLQCIEQCISFFPFHYTSRHMDSMVMSAV